MRNSRLQQKKNNATSAFNQKRDNIKMPHLYSTKKEDRQDGEKKEEKYGEKNANPSSDTVAATTDCTTSC